MEELQLVNRVQAEVKRIACEAHITPEYLHTMLVDEKIADDFATTLAVRVIFTLMGRVVSTDQSEAETLNKTEEVGYYHIPKNWWEGLKFRIISAKWLNWMFSDKALTEWVKYDILPKTHNYITHEKKEIRHYHLCPLPDGVANTITTVNFLKWDRAFTGTQREYVLLRMVAKECILMMSDNQKLALMPEPLLSAVSEYLTEVTRQPNLLDNK